MCGRCKTTPGSTWQTRQSTTPSGGLRSSTARFTRATHTSGTISPLRRCSRSQTRSRAAREPTANSRSSGQRRREWAQSRSYWIIHRRVTHLRSPSGSRSWNRLDSTGISSESGPRPTYRQKQRSLRAVRTRSVQSTRWHRLLFESAHRPGSETEWAAQKNPRVETCRRLFTRCSQ